MAPVLRSLKGLLLWAGLALAGLPLAAGAEVPLPDVLKKPLETNGRFSDTQGCVEPTDVMRKKHFEFLLHQRDETLRKGVRTRQHSFEECINCHVPPADSGKVVRVTSKEHFCNSCHTYAGVTIDCFDCHRDTPTPKNIGFHPLAGKSKAMGHHMDMAQPAEPLNPETLSMAVEGAQQ